MADKAAEMQQLALELKKKTESLFSQIDRHRKKLGAKKTDTRLQLLRRQLRKKQRQLRHITGKDKPKKEGEEKK